MTDAKSRRTAVLLAWRTAVDTAGETGLPTHADLRKVGAAGRCWPPHVDTATLEPWRRSVEYLFARVAAGSVDPVADLSASPLGLSRPGSNGPDPATGDGVPSALSALYRWRVQAVADGEFDVADVRDSDLARLARSGARDAERIRAMLPDAAAGQAENVASLLAMRDAAANGAEPAAAPEVPDPARDAAVPAPEQAGADDLAGLDFAPIDHQLSDTRPVHDVRVTAGPSGSVLTWPALDGGSEVVIYRVGSADEYPPYSPDVGSTVAVTTACRAVDARAFEHALRHVRVWVHAGASREEAVQNPPVLHAETAVVAPVRDVQLRQDEGQVVGQWRVLPGTESVHVLRVPMERAARDAGDPRYRILADRDNLAGFVDGDVERGHRYLYQVSAAARVAGGVQMSASVDVDLMVTAVHAAVTDLSHVLYDGKVPMLDLRWSDPPAGTVAIHRTEQPPRAGAGRQTIDQQALPEAGLPESARLLHPIERLGDGSSGMVRLPWPDGWVRAWFTPVTLLDGSARIGDPVCVTRIGTVLAPQIVERTDKQVVTFGWPSQAAAVRMYRGVPGQDPRSATTGGCDVILEGQYRRLGGLHLTADPLPPGGCSVHLVAVAMFDGEPVLGPPVTLNYPGLLRMRYAVEPKRTVAGKLTTVTVRIAAQVNLARPPAFVLVHRPDRLPLHLDDGRPLAVRPSWDSTAAPAMRFVPPGLSPGEPDTSWTADVRGLSGFVRLFADVDEARRSLVSLADPPVAELRLVPTYRWWVPR